MTITLTWKTGVFDPYTRDQAPLTQKQSFAAGESGTSDQRATAQAELFGLPDFVAELQATTDNSNLQAVDLTDEGVTFASRTFREVRLKSWCFTDNDTYYYETVETVMGGTTPKLMGQKIVNGWNEQNGTVFETGKVHFAATITALTTITTIFASKGLALSDIASGVADLTVPQNRLILNKGCCLDATMVSATAAGHIVAINYTNLDGNGGGTGGVVFVDMTGVTTATTDDPKVGTRLDLAFEIWPPFNHRLVKALYIRAALANTNNVEVQCAGTDAVISDDNLKHRVEVFVGPARVQPYSAV